MMVNMFHQFQVIYIQQFSWCFDAFLGSIFQILLYKGVPLSKLPFVSVEFTRIYG